MLTGKKGKSPLASIIRHIKINLRMPVASTTRPRDELNKACSKYKAHRDELKAACSEYNKAHRAQGCL